MLFKIQTQYWNESSGYEPSQFPPFTHLARSFQLDEENDPVPVTYKTSIFKIKLKIENIDAIKCNLYVW